MSVVCAFSHVRAATGRWSTATRPTEDWPGRLAPCDFRWRARVRRCPPVIEVIRSVAYSATTRPRCRPGVAQPPGDGTHREAPHSADIRDVARAHGLLAAIRVQAERWRTRRHPSRRGARGRRTRRGAEELPGLREPGRHPQPGRTKQGVRTFLARGRPRRSPSTAARTQPRSPLTVAIRVSAAPQSDSSRVGFILQHQGAPAEFVLGKYDDATSSVVGKVPHLSLVWPVQIDVGKVVNDAMDFVLQSTGITSAQPGCTSNAPVIGKVQVPGRATGAGLGAPEERRLCAVGRRERQLAGPLRDRVHPARHFVLA